MLALKHLSIPELIGAAGGDPWKINDTVQAGSPGEISELATSFRQAGLCITETDEEFLQAKKRFEESWDRDDPAHPINDAEQDQARADAKSYDETQRAADETQRAADEALVNSDGPETAEKQAAAGRLRDFATVNDPNAEPYARQYAGERLDDYNMSKFVGPLPVDPVLNTDARQQAKTRLEWQQKLEAGLLGSAPMSPDAATASVMTVLKGLGSLSDSVGTGVEQYGTSKETGRHALAGLSKADAELFTKWGSRVGWVGNIATLVIAGIEYPDNDWNPNEELGKATGGVLGSALGGMAAGAAVGSFGGPFTAAGAAVIGGVLGGFAGSDIGGSLLGQLDPNRYAPGGGGGSW